MYELTRIISGGKHNDHRPEVQKFRDHSPLLIGVPVYFTGRPDGKFFRTSTVKDLSMLHPNVWHFETESGSIYELRKI